MGDRWKGSSVGYGLVSVVVIAGSVAWLLLDDLTTVGLVLGFVLLVVSIPLEMWMIRMLRARAAQRQDPSAGSQTIE